MIKPCFPIFKKKWMQGVLILLGIGTLAFSQLENTESNLPTDSSEAAALIAKHFNENQIRLERH